ncbi:MAG TPA: fatty acid desaturase [Tepidisphaeraceae bacterium]
MNVLSSPRTASDADAAESTTPVKKPWIEQAAMAFGVGVPFLGLIAAIIVAWGKAVGWTDIVLLLSFYCFSILGVTIGFHRMFTHRALQAGPVLRFIVGAAGSMSGQGPVLEWCAVHRQHHKYSDREGDPHSPHLHGGAVGGILKGMLHAHFGWLFSHDAATKPAIVADLVADPVLRFVDRFFWVWMLLGWIVPGIIGGLISHSWFGALTGFLWGGMVRSFLLHHVTWSINSVCHIWGARPFNTPDHSRNNAIFGILAFGEGWHNNHHAFPTSARHGLRWWQFDITYVVIRCLEVMKLVWKVRLPAADAIESRMHTQSSAA